jgi:hypothetical protein
VRLAKVASISPLVVDWVGNRLIGIDDFRHARYATDGAELLMLG